MIAAGVAAGSSALFRFDVGVYAICALGLSAAMLVGWRHATVPFLGGVAIVCLPTAAVFAAVGAVPDLLFDNLVFPARSYAATRSLPFPSLSELAADRYQTAIYVPIAVVALTLPAALIGGRRREGRSEDVDWAKWLALSLAALSALLYLKGLVRVHIVHMALSFLPSALLAVVSLGLARRGSTAVRALVALSLASVAVPTIDAIRHDIDAGRANYAWASSPATWSDPASPSSCRPSPRLARLRCFVVDPTWSKVIEDLQARSRADQPIFVGLAHHDRVFVDDVLIYFAAQRRPATKWYHFDPGLQSTAAIQTEIISELQATKPPIAVLDDTWSNVREPNASALSSGVTILDDYLASHFHRVEQLGPYDVVEP